MSEAFNSSTCRPASSATKTAVVVLPIPGGPERSAALKGPLGDPMDRFGPLGLLKVSSHLVNPIFVVIMVMMVTRRRRKLICVDH